MSEKLARTTSTPSISSPADSPARTSRSRGKAQASPESEAGCGSSTCGSCRSCDPLGFSLRTSLLSELAEQTQSSMVWQRRATPAGRSWWVLAMSERRTDATESGSSGGWSTPLASMAGGDQRLNVEARSWATPHANAANGAGRHGDGGPNLQTQVQDSAWPTPASRDWRDDGDSPSAVTLAMWRTPQAADGTHNHCEAPAHQKGTVALPLTLQVQRVAAVQQNWTTPQAQDAKQTGSAASIDRDLLSSEVVRYWLTATASDAMGSGSAGYGKVSRSTGRRRSEGVTLTDATVGPRGPTSRSTSGKSHGWFTPHGMGNEGNPRRNGPSGNELGRQVGQQGPKGRLNHRWVAQLMGFPSDWLDGIEETP